MRSVTAQEMREIDEKAIHEYGIPSLLLMENAGRAVAEEVIRLAKKPKATVAVFSGKGNNGGDGFVTARHLYNRGSKLLVVFFQSPAGMKPDPLTNFKILKKMNVQLIDGSEDLDCWDRIRQVFDRADIIVDALFGTGLSKSVEEPFRRTIELINESKRPVVAVDIPSGLHSDTGEVMGVCVRATVTVTLGLPKKGFYIGEGPKYTGEVRVADISIPRELLVDKNI